MTTELLMDDLLRLAHGQGASDLHLTAGLPPVLRRNGLLQPLGGAPLGGEAIEGCIRQVLTDEQYATFTSRGECDRAYGLPGVSRFRLNAYRQSGSAALAARVVPHRVPALAELGLPPAVVALVERQQGLVIVTGPTGSGKSTTLAALVDHLNETKRLHILTLEDPIEYVHAHKRSMVNQREVGSDTAAFGQGLRAALRQDPDVILVGELRDLETMRTAVAAAETGHLVLTTLHTPDAPQAVDRLIDMFPPEQQRQIRMQLAAALAGVVAQRLLPRPDGQGRVAAFEVLVNTPAVANLIRTEKVHQIRMVMQTGRSHGMQLLETHLQELLGRGLVTPEAARQYMTGSSSGEA
jgi:twitching motility protein PilT